MLFVRAFTDHALMTVCTFYQTAKQCDPVCCSPGISSQQMYYHLINMTVYKGIKSIFNAHPFLFCLIYDFFDFMIGCCPFSLQEHSRVAFIQKDSPYHSRLPLALSGGFKSGFLLQPKTNLFICQRRQYSAFIQDIRNSAQTISFQF